MLKNFELFKNILYFYFPAPNIKKIKNMLSTYYQHEQKIQRLEHEIKVLEAKLKEEPETKKNHHSIEQDESDSLYDFIVPWQI